MLFIMISRFMLLELPLYRGVALLHGNHGVPDAIIVFALTANEKVTCRKGSSILAEAIGRLRLKMIY